MWTCAKCGEQHQDQFDTCWKCSPVPQLKPEPTPGAARDLNCLRCETQLEYAGAKNFHEGTRWGLIGDLGELFVKRAAFHLYHCPSCGKVEFFVD